MTLDDDVPTVMDVILILRLELVSFLSDNFGDLVGIFPCRIELTSACFFGVLKDSSYVGVSI